MPTMASMFGTSALVKPRKQCAAVNTLSLSINMPPQKSEGAGLDQRPVRRRGARRSYPITLQAA